MEIAFKSAIIILWLLSALFFSGCSQTKTENIEEVKCFACATSEQWTIIDSTVKVYMQKNPDSKVIIQNRMCQAYQNKLPITDTAGTPFAETFKRSIGSSGLFLKTAVFPIHKHIKKMLSGSYTIIIPASIRC